MKRHGKHIIPRVTTNVGSSRKHLNRFTETRQQKPHSY
ncbi:High-affinity glucose transporter, partial [Fusarium oxysporum f. sp. albedinis]